MLEKEAMMRELWRRMALVPGVSYTARNPKAEPSSDDFPCISLYELQDEVIEKRKRGKLPVYIRECVVIIEPFTSADSEPASSSTFLAFLELMKIELYRGGANLGGTALEVSETEMSRIHRPPVGDNSAGAGIAISVKYIEDIQKLY